MRRLYRLILLLLPRRYDDRDRTEMLETFEARVASAERQGSSAWATQLMEVVDLSRAVVGSRLPRGLPDSLTRDVRLGLRSLVRSPLTSALAVLSLALGLGATSAIYSCLDVWLIRPLPLPNADRLLSVAMANRTRGWNANVFSPRDLFDWRAESQSVLLAGYRPSDFSVSTEQGAERIAALRVSANLLAVLGLRPQAGRDLIAEDEKGASKVALLSEGLAIRKLSSVSSAVGSSLFLDGERYTVVGVLPPMAMPELRADVWIPLTLTTESPRAGHSIYGVGRLRQGSSLAAARAELDTVASAVAAEDPQRTFPDARVIPLRDSIYGEVFEQGGAVLGAAVLFVLLIACANIANLLLARGALRGREIAVRAALGAGRSRIVRQLLTESAVLAALGGIAGVGVAHIAIGLLIRHVLPPDVPGLDQIGLNPRVLAVSAGLTVLSALVFGLIPAVRASKADLRSRLAGAVGTGTRGEKALIGRFMVVAEITLSLALLAASGVLILSIVRLQAVDMGLRTDQALSFSLYVPPAVAESRDGVVAFHRQVMEEIASLPGVVGVAGASGPPLGGWSTLLYSPPGAVTEDAARRSAENRIVTADYQRVAQMELVAGRWFSEDIDRRGTQKVAVVSRTLAELHWDRSSEALGNRVELSGERWTIVGVVESGRVRGPQRPPPEMIFRPFDQLPTRQLFYVVDATSGGDQILAQVQERIRALAPTLALDQPRTLRDLFREQMMAEAATLRILGTLAASALLLTLVGIYGVVANSVGRRTRELGLRLALGADSGGLLRWVLGQSLKLASVGLALGIALSVVLGQGLSLFLGGVRPADPGALGVAAALMVGVVILASYLPARRASRADPVESLRAD